MKQKLIFKQQVNHLYGQAIFLINYYKNITAPSVDSDNQSTLPISVLDRATANSEKNLAF